MHWFQTTISIITGSPTGGQFGAEKILELSALKQRGAAVKKRPCFNAIWKSRPLNTAQHKYCSECVCQKQQFSGRRQNFSCKRIRHRNCVLERTVLLNIVVPSVDCQNFFTQEYQTQ